MSIPHRSPLKGFLKLLLIICGVLIGGTLRARAVDAPGAPPTAPLQPEQLQQLVAPIALYPDALVAQILAASAYPTQIVVAERFMQQNQGLKGAALGSEVDQQDWDPSVKALTQFPSVLADMDKNLSWTSELGDANINQQAEVMNAVQTMREKAQAGGNLKTTSQQTVANQGSTVVIQPTDPNIIYVPVYNPDWVYGYPVGVWPGLYPWWGVGPTIVFGVGFGISPFFGFGWGWHGWGVDWHGRGLIYGGGRYAYRSRSFYNRGAYFHGGPAGGYRNAAGHAGSYARGDRGVRGYSAPGATRGSTGLHSGAVGQVNHGADARLSALRGRSSLGSVRGGSTRRK